MPIVKRNLHIILIVLLMLLSFGLSIYAQVSPFDQRHKLTKDQLARDTNTNLDVAPLVAPPTVDSKIEVPGKNTSQITTTTAEVNTAQPIGTVDESEVLTADDTRDTSALIDEAVEESEYSMLDDGMSATNGKDKNRSLFLFMLIIGATILTTLTISSNKSLVNNILRAVLNDNYLNLIYRAQKKSGSFHYYILYFVFAVNAGLFLYFTLSHLVLENELPMLWRCVILIGIIYAVRHLFMSYMAYVYPFEKEAEQYAFTILIFNIFLGLVLLPINVFIAFSPEPISTFFLYGGLAMISIVYVFRQLRGIFISSRLLVTNKFYFLLYLCAVEIAPILLLVKYSGVYVS